MTELVDYERGVALKSWNDPPASVVAPVAVLGRRVRAILRGCLVNCKSVRECRFEDAISLNKIEKDAFCGCRAWVSCLAP